MHVDAFNRPFEFARCCRLFYRTEAYSVAPTTPVDGVDAQPHGVTILAEHNNTIMTRRKVPEAVRKSSLVDHFLNNPCDALFSGDTMMETKCRTDGYKKKKKKKPRYEFIARKHSKTPYSAMHLFCLRLSTHKKRNQVSYRR
jgi:hypothetical protein